MTYRAPGERPAVAAPLVEHPTAGPASPQLLSEAEAAFLERCRLDLEPLVGPRDAVLEVAQRPVEDGLVELEAHVVVSGRPAAIAARGGTIVEAHGRLRALLPERRLALAFRALIDAPDAR
jgi:hypothetical protein